ncbi:MAG: DUF4387 domain-containing protein [Chloroflexi bacterium]|nr:DUF4387 domain-containing protein [Chloroflexota bacterium]
MTAPPTVNLRSLATVIRSKNAGPFRFTLDILFRDAETYRRLKTSGAITPELIAGLYRLPADRVTDFVWFDPGRALKITLVRPVSSGAPGDTDVYGAQQHAPLLGLELPTELLAD